MEPLLPYPADHAVLDYIKVGSTDEGTLLTVLAAKKDLILQHLQQWSKMHIEPEIVTAIPAALATFAAMCAPSEQTYCIVHLGLEQSTCVLIQQGQLIAAQAIQQGITHLQDALERETGSPKHFGDIDISHLSLESHPLLYPVWDSMRLDIKRIIFSLAKQARQEPLKELLLTGTGALIPHLATTLAKDLEMQLILPRQEIFPTLTIGQIQNYAIPIGEALTGLPRAKDKINFRQGDLSYPHPWKRLWNSIALYSGLCLALAIAFYLFGQSYLSYRQDQVKQTYIDLLTVMNKPYDNFEEEYETKTFSPNNSHQETMGIAKLTESDLYNRVEYLEKGLQATPDIFPLLPHVPKVSDVLAWLSSQRMLKGKSKIKGEMLNVQPIQIESFNYSFVKRPEQNKKQEKYQVKVEIEFTSPTPKQAREFHDALIEPNDFVDPKGEVKWNSSHGRYRTSFYLKDKTIYP